MIKRALISCILLVISVSGAFSQGRDFRQKFEQGNLLILEQFYDTALQIFLDLHRMDTGNANVSYKVGYLYLQSTTEKLKAIPFLERACRNVTKKYMEFEPSEKGAPQSSYFFLAQAYHLDYRFADAITYFEKFKATVHPKDGETLKDISHRIEWSKNGTELVKAPMPYVITNLGDSVNSPYGDYSPVITADEKFLYFTSRRSGMGGEDNRTLDLKYFEDIWYCERKSDGTWSTAKNMGPTVNSFDHEATIGLSADGSQLFVYKDIQGDGGIFISELNGLTWSTPEKLGSEPADITDINTTSWETHACVTADGGTLYFVSDRKGGYGGRDIYKCVKLPNGRWSKAMNLGPQVNTPYDEDAPFIHPDGITLFFSSKGHRSMGGFDIFFTAKNDSGWRAPENMGYPINTTDDDIFYVMSTDGRRAYFSSFRDGSKGEKDIYMVSIPTPIVEPVALMVGLVKTANGEPLPDDLFIRMTNAETGETKDYKVNTASGRYISPLQPNKDYTWAVEVGGNVIYSENIKTPFVDFNEDGKEYKLKTIILDGTTARTEGDAVLPPDSAGNTVVTNPPKDPKNPKDPKDPKDPKNPSDPKNPKNPSDPKDPKNPSDPNRPKDGSVKNSGSGQPKSTITDSTNADYAKYFTYNKSKIGEDDEKFKMMIDKLEQKLKNGEKVKVVITTCASKVPTGGKLYKTNGELAHQRAIETEARIRKALKERGLTVENIDFKVFYKVRGPEYKGDYIENREVYEQFQYTKVYLKPADQ